MPHWVIGITTLCSIIQVFGGPIVIDVATISIKGTHVNYTFFQNKTTTRLTCAELGALEKLNNSDHCIFGLRLCLTTELGDVTCKAQGAYYIDYGSLNNKKDNAFFLPHRDVIRGVTTFGIIKNPNPFPFGFNWQKRTSFYLYLFLAHYYEDETKSTEAYFYDIDNFFANITNLRVPEARSFRLFGSSRSNPAEIYVTIKSRCADTYYGCNCETKCRENEGHACSKLGHAECRKDMYPKEGKNACTIRCLPHRHQSCKPDGTVVCELPNHQADDFGICQPDFTQTGS